MKTGTIKGGMFVSKDSGKNWAQINNGLLKNLANPRVPGFIAGLAVCETKPEVAYISTINPMPDEKGASMKSIAFSKQSMAEIAGNRCLCLPRQRDL